ncbi:MAG: hypothetical protein IJX49_01175 [Clostridia bacterium]|nr:hypothetical protein [Clostridia bacterium]
MRSEEFISAISGMSHDDDQFEAIKKGLPLGLDSVGNVVRAQKMEKPFTLRNTCVTGTGRSRFIRRFLITVSCLYEKSEACFFVISPKTEYGELLRLKSMDITVPFIREKGDVQLAIEAVKELLAQRENGKGYPHLFLILDGLEELPECNRNGDLEEYREIFELFNRRKDVDVICGADLMRSIFSGHPGAFVGVGNCLVTIREEGKADVTYVDEDVSLSMPIPISYPNEPSVLETVIYLNALPTSGGVA